MRNFEIRSLLKSSVWQAALIAVLLLSSALMVTAQTPQSFDVASVKRNTQMSEAVSFAALPGGRLHIVNNPMANVIANAYGIPQNQLENEPDWLHSERYDIEAKAPESASEKEMMSMLQNLLADRFAMKAHFETREMHSYTLKVAKGGQKIKLLSPVDCTAFDSSKDQSADPNICGGNRVGVSTWIGTHISMPNVTTLLSRMLGGPVVDQTGIKGTFDVELHWADDLQTNESSADTLPSLGTALRDTLGLELTTQRNPVTVLVIDHIERPTTN